jgi:aminoglycoside 3-N-acetyltransferase
MSEAGAVEKTKGMPATVQSLTDDLSALGVSSGTTLLVHSSLGSLGWVCGGAVSVVLALEKALGPEGTLAMPTHSGDMSEPSRWRNPPIPESWWETVRQEMPPFDVDMTPTRGVGVIAECFRKQKGTLRSAHPSVSFAARGPRAKELTEDTSLDFPTGDGSFLARLYDMDGWVLLLGADFRSATSLHLAEYRARYPSRKVIRCGGPVLIDGERRWVEFDEIDYDDSDFPEIGASYVEMVGQARSGRVASGTATLMPHKSLVDYATKWMEENRR